jgi:OOP family OmpA-OmpF porin
MSDDREKLKALLLSEEIAQIEALQKLLNDKQQLSHKVSEILDSATDLTIANNPAYLKKFSKIDSQAYVRAIKANKQTFIDALLPIIGPMIRKSVSSAIRRFVADVNRAVEMNISVKALKWRWTAIRTGVPIAEIIFNNTIEYQVQQVFLIDNHTGLLIEHAGHEASLLQDKDAMSAMLTAIQDFVKDSVSSDGEGLTAAELGDSLVWLVHGNKANMAVVIKGAPTQRLHDTIVSVTENIHIDFHQEIEDQNRWNNSPELKIELEKLLLTKTQSDDQEQKTSINFWPWLLAILALLGWWSWSTYQHRQLTQQMHHQISQVPGFVLSDLQYQDNKFIATGLQDPLADVSALDKRIVIQSTPFISLDENITIKRIETIFNDPNLTVNIENQTVTLSGTIDKSPEMLQKAALLNMVPGVNNVLDLSTQKSTITWQSFIQNNPPPDNIQVRSNEQTLYLSGATTQQRLDDFVHGIEEFGTIDTTAVETYSFNELQQLIKNNPITSIDFKALTQEQIQKVDAVIRSFHQLKTIKTDAKIKLTGQSDCQGSVTQSNEYSQARLDLVADYFYNNGVDKKTMVTELIECTTTNNDIDTTKIAVWFEVV